jgi:hypothetical protein
MAVEAALLIQSIDRVFATVFARPVVECFARSGPFLLRLVFARRSLADEFLPSFLRDEMGPADLQIGFLTSVDADLSHLIPHPPNEYRTIASDDCFAMWQPGDWPMLYLLDRKSNRALIWLAADAAPDWIASRPALPLMAAFSLGTKWIALHAAAIGQNGRILLLAGDGRAGKTTAALSCAYAGWDYAGDDYVLVNTANAAVEPLYCSARLRADMASAFADWLNAPAQISSSDGEPRYELRLGGERGRDRIKGGSLAAILLPRRRGAKRPEFAPARRIDAVAGLKTSMSLAMTHFHRDTREATIKKIVTVIGLAPVYFVDTGQCPANIPVAFAEFLDRL